MRTSVRIRVLAIALAAAGIAHAGAPVDERRSMPADGRVQIDNLAGTIEIEGWDRDEVHITGELGDSVEELEISESTQGVTVTVRNRENQRFVEETDLRLKIPVAASVIAEGVSADIGVSGLDGGHLVFTTVSGDIDVDARAPRVELESVSGDVVFRGQTARATVETVSGEIDLEGVAGEVQVTTVSGDVDLRGGAVSIARFETVSGDLDLALEVTDGGRLNADSMSGDVDITFPGDQQGQFSARTFSGEIRADFGSIDRASRGPGSRLDHHEGTGGAAIRVESFSGDVSLNRH